MPCEMTSNEIKMLIRKIMLVSALENWDSVHTHNMVAPYQAVLDERRTRNKEQIVALKAR